jgi:hypothetical protein
MRFRLKAFGLHLLGSAIVLTLVLGSLWLGWYRWPGWYLSSVLHVVGIVVIVDLVIGPTLTLIVANPRKPGRILARDVSLIVTVQLAALMYGTVTLWNGRPLYYAFSTNSLDCVQASDIDASEAAVALRQNPTLAPHWYSLPRWIWAPLPPDPQTRDAIIGSAISGGKDVTAMPRYYKDWAQGLPELRTQLKKVDEQRYFSRAQRKILEQRLRERGLATDDPNTLPMTGHGIPLLAVFDPATLRIRALLTAAP